MYQGFQAIEDVNTCFYFPLWIQKSYKNTYLENEEIEDKRVMQTVKYSKSQPAYI